MTLSASQIKYIRSLKDKKTRDEEGLFVVEGEKMVSEVMGSGLEVTALYRAEEVGEKVMERISLMSTPSPVLAVVRKPQMGPLDLKDGGLYLALDDIRDPGNMGTILRIADWFGIDAVFASETSVDIYNPKTVQSTMGAIFRVPFAYCDLSSLCSMEGVSVFGTFLCGENIYSADLSAAGPSVIVVGNESRGISDGIAALCGKRLTIPSFARCGSGSESLNAAVATAVTVSEFKRRQE